MQNEANWTKDYTADSTQQRPEEFGSLWHELGFNFSMAMSQILTVQPRTPIVLRVTNHDKSTLCLDSL